MSAETTTLTIPSRAEYARTVRMTAAALVSRTALTYDDVDDVRIAAEEAFVYACDHAPENEVVEIQFTLDAAVFQIRVGIMPGERMLDEEMERRAAYATFILQAVSDRFEMSSDESGAYLKVEKNIPAEQPHAEG